MTSSARSPVPSLRAIRARWLFTVSADRPSAVPISLLDWPSATSWRTSISRADRPSDPLGRVAGAVGSPAGDDEGADAGGEGGAHGVGVGGRGDDDGAGPTLGLQVVQQADAGAVGQPDLGDAELTRAHGPGAQPAFERTGGHDDLTGAEAPQGAGDRLAGAGVTGDHQGGETTRPGQAGRPRAFHDNRHKCLRCLIDVDRRLAITAMAHLRSTSAGRRVHLTG